MRTTCRVRVRAAPASTSEVLCFSLYALPSVLPCGLPHELAHDQFDQSGGAGRHQVNDEYENDPVDRASEAFGNMLGDIGHKEHEQAAEQRAGNRADAAYHQADEQRDGKCEREAVR